MSYTTPYIIIKDSHGDRLFSPVSRNIDDLYYDMKFVEDEPTNWSQAQAIAQKYPEFYSIA